jgi:O-methyltransferase
VLRLDGDLYQSTMDALEAMEPKVAAGGYVIVDDYGGWMPCRRAVDDYRASRGITATMHEVDWTGVWWQKAWPPRAGRSHRGQGLDRDVGFTK